MQVDLHCHTTASDGKLSPSDMVLRAKAMGVDVLSVTDHDTLAGLQAARQTAVQQGIVLINGVELSCIWQGMTIHILGYGFDGDAEPLNALVASVGQGRWARAEEIARRLAAKGMPGALDGAKMVQSSLGEVLSAPARPHFADYLVQAGYVKDRAEAFRKWLGAGKIGDIKQHWPELTAVIDCLGQSGAAISLAHPFQYNMTRSKRRRLVMDFVAAGGQAIEVANGLQPAEQVGRLAILTREFGLAASAGSDFHGPGPWSELGRYRALPEDLTVLWPCLIDTDQGRSAAWCQA